jgi:hypothetical protein
MDQNNEAITFYHTLYDFYPNSSDSISEFFHAQEPESSSTLRREPKSSTINVNVEPWVEKEWDHFGKQH